MGRAPSTFPGPPLYRLSPRTTWPLGVRAWAASPFFRLLESVFAGMPALCSHLVPPCGSGLTPILARMARITYARLLPPRTLHPTISFRERFFLPPPGYQPPTEIPRESTSLTNHPFSPFCCSFFSLSCLGLCPVDDSPVLLCFVRPSYIQTTHDATWPYTSRPPSRHFC